MIKYCSLQCYSDTRWHGDCTQAFQQQQVESALKNKCSTQSDRLDMQATLKKHQQSQFDERIDVDLVQQEIDAEEESMSLQDRLSKIDLDKTSFDHIWSHMSDKERKQFTEMLENCDDLPEFVPWVPWWHLTDNNNALEESQVPHIMQFPKSSAQMIPLTEGLILNMMSIVLTYSFVMRHFAGDLRSAAHETFYDTQMLIYSLCPLLISGSKLVYESIDQVIVEFMVALENAGLDDKVKDHGATENTNGVQYKQQSMDNNDLQPTLEEILAKDVEVLVSDKLLCMAALSDFAMCIDLPDRCSMFIQRKLVYYLMRWKETDQIDVSNVIVNDLKQCVRQRKLQRKKYSVEKQAMETLLSKKNMVKIQELD